MANPEHLAILKQGVKIWNRWRQKHPAIEPRLDGADLFGSDLVGANLVNVSLAAADLRGVHLHLASLVRADLHDADLTMADMRQANLTEANLHCSRLIAASLVEANLGRADLSSADLNEADLSRAQLSRANLNRANLTRSNLREADLRGADLSWTNLNSSILETADFSEAVLMLTVFANVDLRTCKGLDTLLHRGPSSIGMETVHQSQGVLPEVFLGGAGMPDTVIRYSQSLTTGANFNSCFISYSTRDQEFADHLHTNLQMQGVRCWFAPHDIQGGKKLHEQIDHAIRVYDRLLLILSEASMASDWVKTEIANARQREIREARKMLFPISLVPYDQIKEWKAFDADNGKDSAREIREYFIPDFSNWKDHDSYQAAFQRLLRDLKAEKPSQRP